jgi:crotonobetainyl-CoA:carnitine CoA-transferase CaiB-like acyl-CoA transferase
MTDDTKLPLAGLRIVDISNVISLPYACGLLADLGAEVIKVEGHSRLDTTRGGAITTVLADNRVGDDPWNRTGGFNLLNRGKKSVALDLSRPEGRVVLTDLIKVSDVLMENFTPRVMRNWGLDYPNAAKLRPGLIMVSCSGFGHTGPYSQYPGQATTLEATHGLAYVTGYRDGEPSKAGQSFVDFLATWALVSGTMLGLRYKHRFGKGLWVDVGMYQLGTTMLSERVLDWEANQRLGERIGNRHPFLAPQGCYRCAGDDAWCTLLARDDAEWAALCRTIGRPELASDERFATNDLRRTNHDAIDAIIGAWMAHRTKFGAMERLQAAGVPAGAVFDASDIHLNPHMRARGLLETVAYPPDRAMGKQRMVIGRPWKLSKLPLAVRGPGPRLGEHNQEVLGGVLGYSPERMAELAGAGIIGTQPSNARKPVSMSMEERVKSGRLASWDPDYKERLGIED